MIVLLETEDGKYNTWCETVSSLPWEENPTNSLLNREKLLLQC